MPRERHFVPRVNQLLVRNKQQMKANMDARREQVVDARSARRFAGLDRRGADGARPASDRGTLRRRSREAARGRTPCRHAGSSSPTAGPQEGQAPVAAVQGNTMSTGEISGRLRRGF